MKKALLVIAFVASMTALSAQDKGYLTGSFETNDHIYVKDEANKFTPADDNFGSNNYLKLDYYNGNFSAGLQLESYMPAIIGYPDDLNKYALSNMYVNWKDEDFQITAGTFYDQFGSGLLFRSWEDRALGLNNAVMGARFNWNYKDIVAFKALWGLPRFGMGVFTNNTKQPKTLTNTETQVRGADLSFVLSNLVGWNSTYLALEGSVLNRYEPISIDLIDEGGKPNTFGWSGRANFETNGFFAKAEWVGAGDKYYNNPDPSDGNWYLKKKGNAQLLELGYNGRGLGVTLTGRRLEWMDSKIIAGNTSTSNMMNYIPAMCTQYTYMLTTHHPYNAQTGNIIGIFIGVFLLLCCQDILSFSMLWKLLFPAIIVIVGLKMVFSGLFGNKANEMIKQLKLEGKQPKSGFAAFSGNDIRYDGEVFEGAELTAVFGGIKCDLRNAVITQDCAIGASAIFGGIDILVPDNVNVKVNSSSIFGGVSNKTAVHPDAPTIYVSGICMFGGIDIK